MDPLFLGRKKRCKSRKCLIYTFFSGEGGIRTPGTSQYNGFQDRRNRPLCHLSRTPSEVLYFSKAMQKYRFF